MDTFVVVVAELDEQSRGDVHAVDVSTWGSGLMGLAAPICQTAAGILGFAL
jgi:hypothetical protein